MLDRDAILRLIPHRGAMCLLDRVERHDAEGIACRATSHLDPANPLRAEGRLGAAAGIEYGLQAAAVHGALAGDRRAGLIASVTAVALHVDRLDDPGFGMLSVAASPRHRAAAAAAYRFVVRASDGRLLVSGDGLISFGGG